VTVQPSDGCKFQVSRLLYTDYACETDYFVSIEVSMSCVKSVYQNGFLYRRLEIEDELRRTGRAFADGAFDEDDYDRRRKKLFAERDSLVIPDRAKAIEMGMQLETIGDFMDDATDDEKYKIMHILFNAVYYDFGQKQLVGFKPQSDFVPIFRLAAPFSGWTETMVFVFRTTIWNIDGSTFTTLLQSAFNLLKSIRKNWMNSRVSL